MKYLLCILTALQFAGTVAAQQAVDLGLSVLWADCNMGATEPGDAGPPNISLTIPTESQQNQMVKPYLSRKTTLPLSC